MIGDSLWPLVEKLWEYSSTPNGTGTLPGCRKVGNEDFGSARWTGAFLLRPDVVEEWFKCFPKGKTACEKKMRTDVARKTKSETLRRDPDTHRGDIFLLNWTTLRLVEQKQR